ncbi:MAG: hypothetical protein KC425_17435 [Anaerolineales bacterium]|nr:hypothetical protein [Anaerolineales bacterium]
MTLQIDRVTSQQQLQTFVRFPWTVYQNDPYWVPPLYHERLAFFNHQQNPFFDHSEVDYFIARRGETVVGTIAAILNHRHNQIHDQNVAHFGIFEVLPDPEAARALLDTACDWAARRGVNAVLGPMNLSTNDECGLLIDGFDSPPVIMMTYNPPRYAGYLTDAGFGKAMDLWAWWHDIHALVENMPPKLLRVVQKVQARYDLTLRHVNMHRWDAEVALLRRLYNGAWAQNWGFVPMTDAEFDHLAHTLRPILDPNLIFVVEKAGEPVGFALSLPDANQPLHRFHPRPWRAASYLAGAYTLLRRRRADGLRVLVLGVVEPYRQRGVDALLYYETAKAAATHGYQWAESSWILETNDMMNRSIAMLGGTVYKTYRIYEKALP